MYVGVRVRMRDAACSVLLAVRPCLPLPPIGGLRNHALLRENRANCTESRRI